MPSPNAAQQYQFILFIAGMSGNSVIAVENMRRICDEYLDGNCEIQIVDLNREPHLAMQHQIIAVPTLIKMEPKPSRTILGDLSNVEKVLKILEIKH